MLNINNIFKLSQMFENYINKYAQMASERLSAKRGWNYVDLFNAAKHLGDELGEHLIHKILHKEPISDRDKMRLIVAFREMPDSQKKAIKEHTKVDAEMAYTSIVTRIHPGAMLILHNWKAEEPKNPWKIFVEKFI